MDITFINGVKIGQTGTGLEMNWWCVPRQYSIPSGILYPGRNVIAIRAFTHSYDGSFLGKAKLYYLTSQKNGRFQLPAQWRFKVEYEINFLKLPDGRVPDGSGNPNMPATLFDSMIRPLIPYAFKGVIWYQGEDNANTCEAATAYLPQIKDQILDWRRYMENGDFPFVMVQLPIFGEAKTFDRNAAWALLRQAQQQATEELHDVGCVTMLDAGDADDIHPADKRTVGFWLAQWAIHHVYGDTKIICEGPICLSAKRDGEKVRLNFDSTGTLIAKNDLGGFCAGSDDTCMIEVPAQIEVNDILLQIPTDATQVCYAWSGNPKVTLFNDTGFPAKPFKKRIES